MYENKTDWFWMLEGYNRIKKTSHKTVSEMLTSLYKEQKTLVKAGKILGVSSTTVADEMRRLNIPRLPKGHRGKSKCVRAILSLGNVSQMSTMQVARVVEFSRSYVTVCLQKEGILYRKGRK